MTVTLSNTEKNSACQPKHLQYVEQTRIDVHDTRIDAIITTLHEINEAQAPDIRDTLRFLQSSVSILQFKTHPLLHSIPEMFMW